MIKKLLISIVIVLVFCMSACAKEEVHLQFRMTWEKNSGRGDCIAAIVNEFNREYKGITVELLGGDEETDAYVSALKKGEIDVYVVPYRFLKYRDIASQLQEFDVSLEALKKIHYDSVIEMTKNKDRVIGMPWIGHSMTLIYNQDIVETYGLTPNRWQSLEDLRSACEIISREGGQSAMGMVGADHHDLSWMLSQFIYSFGGQLVESDAGSKVSKVVVNSEAAERALQYYINQLGPYGQENWQEHTGLDVMDAFAEGEIAFEIQGPWGITDIWKRGHKFDIGVIPLSQIGMNSEVGPLMLSMPQKGTHPEEARLFIDYMCSEKALNKIMAGEYDAKHDAYYPFRVPIRKDMQNSDFFRQYPEFYPFVMGFEYPSINTPSPEWAEHGEHLFTQLTHAAIVGDIDIKTALEGIK